MKNYQHLKSLVDALIDLGDRGFICEHMLVLSVLIASPRFTPPLAWISRNGDDVGVSLPAKEAALEHFRTRRQTRYEVDEEVWSKAGSRGYRPIPDAARFGVIGLHSSLSIVNHHNGVKCRKRQCALQGLILVVTEPQVYSTVGHSVAHYKVLEGSRYEKMNTLEEEETG
jgi:hypothetical protein